VIRLSKRTATAELRLRRAGCRRSGEARDRLLSIWSCQPPFHRELGFAEPPRMNHRRGCDPGGGFAGVVTRCCGRLLGFWLGRVWPHPGDGAVNLMEVKG